MRLIGPNRIANEPRWIARAVVPSLDEAPAALAALARAAPPGARLVRVVLERAVGRGRRWNAKAIYDDADAPRELRSEARMRELEARARATPRRIGEGSEAVESVRPPRD